MNMNEKETPNQTLRPIAHVKRGVDGSWIEHALADHLRCVGNIAGNFASDFGAADWAKLAGYWHDLGEISPQFSKLHS